MCKEKKMILINLPDDVLEKILSFISYDEVSRLRLVSRRMNFISKHVLNRGFHKVEKYHAQCLRQVKSQLPRRESERRKHPLSRHCDILTAVETRLSLLGMTYLKFMEMNLCCFIPGKVLDEIYKVLRNVTSEQSPPVPSVLDEIYKVLRHVTSEQSPVRAHEVLQELRDLSSMAMEHFDEKISPAFKKNNETVPKIPGLYARTLCPNKTENRVGGIELPWLHSQISETIAQHTQSLKSNSSVEQKTESWKNDVIMLTQKVNVCSRNIHILRQKVVEMSRRHLEQDKKIKELQTLQAAQVEKAKEQDLRMDFLSKIVEGYFPTSVSYLNNVKGTVKSNVKKKDSAPEPENPKKKRFTRAVANQTDTSRKRLKRD